MIKPKFWEEVQNDIIEEDYIKDQHESYASRFNLDTEVQADPQLFYQDLGLLEHPDTREPVEKLTPYQISVWKDGYRYKRRLVIKSQKTGITTSTLMEDFQKCIKREI